MSQTDRSNNTGLWLLAIGAAVGLGLAGLSIIAEKQDAKAELGSNVAAKINHVLVSREIYEAQLERLASDKKDPMDDEDRAYVLERIIEEELLIQRGVEIGLVERERAVRAAIVAAMIASIVADTQAMDVSAADLRAFYKDNANYFVRSAQLRVRDLYIGFKGDQAGAHERMAGAEKAIKDGEDFAAVKARLGDAQVLQLPDALLPAAKVRDYLGPTILQQVMVAEKGDIIGPVETPGGLHLLHVADIVRDAPLPLDQVQDMVSAEYRKRAGDQALRDYLEWLKARADVIRVPKAPIVAADQP